MKTLVVVDMQKDFIDGALGTAEAAAIVPAAARRVRRAREEGWQILFTLDTHGEDYLSTQEGRNLPVPHCIKGTDGWKLCPEVLAALGGEAPETFEKITFGSPELAAELSRRAPEEVELCGLCTDICVIANAMMIKAFLPEVPVSVNAACCAGVTPERHRGALAAMEACQIRII